MFSVRLGRIWRRKNVSNLECDLKTVRLYKVEAKERELIVKCLEVDMFFNTSFSSGIELAISECKAIIFLVLINDFAGLSNSIFAQT